MQVWQLLILYVPMIYYWLLDVPDTWLLIYLIHLDIHGNWAENSNFNYMSMILNSWMSYSRCIFLILGCSIIGKYVTWPDSYINTAGLWGNQGDE